MGETAVRFARPPEKSAAALLHFFREKDGIVDVVLSEDEIAVYFNPARPPDELSEWIDQCQTIPGDIEPGRRHTISVRYNGPDLVDVAEFCGLTIDEVVRRHSQAEYTVGMLGFLPGFAYLQGLDTALVVPRRDVPRKRVPQNALAIGGAYTAVYPCMSPGGWNLIGEAIEPALFSAQGARLQAGDRVVFTVVR